MGLKPGQTNNKFGRKKGSQNKVTAEVKALIQNIFQHTSANIQEDLQYLGPKGRIKFMVSLLPYLIPKQQSVAPIDEDLIIRLEELDELVDEDD